ncbi:hypothetical protein BH23GEM4_BH23GEM4_23570 [soil metagenome]
MVPIQALMVAGFVLVHLFAGKLRFLDTIPRSRWLSMAGGISVAYVFLHILPELEEAQRNIAEGERLVPWIEHHAYLVALLGLVVFYGLERTVEGSQQRRGEEPDSGAGETTTGMGVFWLHMASFAGFNALIGYLLVHREEQDARGLFFFAVAMALHFLVNDFGLRQDHKNTYRRLGRWILAAAVVLGWVAGIATRIDEAATGVLFAFLAGGVVLNVLKEELPEERQSRFTPFALGAGVYAVLLLLL